MKQKIIRKWGLVPTGLSWGDNFKNGIEIYCSPVFELFFAKCDTAGKPFSRKDQVAVWHRSLKEIKLTTEKLLLDFDLEGLLLKQLFNSGGVPNNVKGVALTDDQGSEAVKLEDGSYFWPCGGGKLDSHNDVILAGAFKGFNGSDFPNLEDSRRLTAIKTNPEGMLRAVFLRNKKKDND